MTPLEMNLHEMNLHIGRPLALVLDFCDCAAIRD
jgi:hypothetical protein